MFDFSFAYAGSKGSGFAVSGAFPVAILTNVTSAHIDSGAIIDGGMPSTNACRAAR